MSLKIFCIGDTYGEPGRKAIERFVRSMRTNGEADFVICNAENSAGGRSHTQLMLVS